MQPHTAQRESSRKVAAAVQVIAARQHVGAGAARDSLFAAAHRWQVSPSEIARGVLLFDDA